MVLYITLTLLLCFLVLVPPIDVVVYDAFNDAVDGVGDRLLPFISASVGESFRNRRKLLRVRLHALVVPFFRRPIHALGDVLGALKLTH